MGTNYYARRKGKEIHLGKRSYGWQFHWQNQPKYYEPNFLSLLNFLLNPDWVIYDEYGIPFTVIEFLESEVGDSLYCDKRHKNGCEEYSEFEYLSIDGLRFSDDEFS